MADNMKQRVITLLRVSTKKQLDRDRDSQVEDIPVQRIACNRFIAQHPDWVLIDEYQEKGVSGHKVRAANRDAIQVIQQRALNKEFDILVVFLFDRLGRIADETPFVLENLVVKCGIRVFSVNEGEQRFENHTDKLTNYIRFWQADGESDKLSIRVTEAMGQMVEEGKFRGGTAPFGYRLVKKGRLNKRGHECHDLEIDENEAAVVRLMFHKYLNEGYGSQRLANFLLDQGIRNRKGCNFTNCTIQHILANEQYIGVLKSGESRSPILNHLQIIDIDTFMQVQDMLKQRSNHYKERNVPRHTKGKGLLAGNLYCGHCGARMIQTSNTKRNKNADGSPGKEYTRIRYVCYNKTRHKHLCNGQTGYTTSKVDAVIDQLMHHIFAQAKDTPQDAAIEAKYDVRMTEMKANLKRAKEHLTKQKEIYDAYKDELLRVIRGESALDRETLNELMMDSKSKVDDAATEVDIHTQALENGWGKYNEIRMNHETFLSWAEMYEGCSLEAKKMIVSKIIESIKLNRDYKMEITFRIGYEQFAGQEVNISSYESQQATIPA